MNREPFFKEVDGRWYIWDNELEKYVEENECEDERESKTTLY